MGINRDRGFDYEVLGRLAHMSSSFCLSVTPVLISTQHETALLSVATQEKRQVAVSRMASPPVVGVGVLHVSTCLYALSGRWVL